MIQKNVASQVVTFNLVNATTGAALTGATVTTKVALDGTQSGGAGTVTELGTGQYKYVPTQGETNGSSVGFSFTATNAVPVNLHCFTIGQDPAATTFAANVTKLLGTAWLTPGTAGTPDVNVKLWNALATVALPLVPTTAGRTLDVSATGEAGVDWANVGSPTTALDLSGTTIKTTQKVDVDTIKTNPVVNGGTITFPTNKTLADTTSAVGSVTGNVGGNVTGSVGSVVGAVGSVTGNVGGNVTGSVGSVATGGIAAASFAAGAIDAAAIAADAIGASEIAADAIGSSELATSAATEIAGKVWDEATSGHTTADTYGDKFGAHLPGVLKVVIGTGSTTTAIVLSTIDGAAPSSVDDFYNGAVLIFTSGALKGQRTSVSDYTGSSTTLTVVAVTGNAANGVTAILV